MVTVIPALRSGLMSMAKKCVPYSLRRKVPTVRGLTIGIKPNSRVELRTLSKYDLINNTRLYST